MKFLYEEAKSMIDEGIETEEVLYCPVCKGRGKILYEGLHDRLYQVPGVWGLLRCTACGSLWLNPRPRPEEIYKCYAEYLTHDDDRNYSTNDKRQDGLGWERFKDIVLPGRSKERIILQKMFLIGKCRGRLLDIGCGNGSYLALMRDLGWEVVGIELDPEAARIAKERFSLNVLIGSWNNIDLPSESFDAITLSHVVEHVIDPYKLLRHCFDLLKPGGKISITTPNIRSLGHRVFRGSWCGLDPPRHLVLFHPESLRCIVQKSGFRILILSTTDRIASGIFELSRKILSTGKATNPIDKGQKTILQSDLIRMLFVFFEHWGNIISRDFGEEIAILAEKGIQSNE